MDKNAIEVFESLARECPFSLNCLAEHVPTHKCNCWRCKTARKEEVTDESNGVAAQEFLDWQNKPTAPAPIKKQKRKKC